MKSKFLTGVLFGLWLLGILTMAAIHVFQPSNAQAQTPAPAQREDCSVYYNNSKITYNQPVSAQMSNLVEMQVWYQRSIALSLIYQNCMAMEKSSGSAVGN